MSHPFSLRSAQLVGALFLIAVLLAACGSDPTPTPTNGPLTTPTANPGVGTVDIRVTDQANGDISAIVITGANFRVSQSSASPPDDETWTTVLAGEHTFDLLKVVGQEEQLGFGELEPGLYNQVRMDVLGATITIDGEEVAARVPSSVLRIVRPFEVLADQVTVLTFDFDADRSVVAAGPNVILKPVVKLLVRGGGEPFVPESAPTPTPASAGTETPEPETPEPTPTPTQ